MYRGAVFPITSSIDDDDPSTDSQTVYSFPKMHLGSLRRGNRVISYSTAGVDSSDAVPVLFFYPLGGNRRMLRSLHEVALRHNLRLVCVNRPGKGGTSRSDKTSHKESPAKIHVDMCLEDAVHVLHELRIGRVALFCMCAGTPFALAFASRHPELTTGVLVGISSWILPADCGRRRTKWLHYLGTLPVVPNRLTSLLVGTVMTSMGASLTSLPASKVASTLRRNLSKQEQKVFDDTIDPSELYQTMKWANEERGGEGGDIAVLLSSGKTLGIDYQAIGETHHVNLWHAEHDKLVPYSGAEWMAERIPLAQLHQLVNGSHEGGLFLLHPSIEDSFEELRAVER